MTYLFTGAISCKAVLESGKRQCTALYVNREKRSRDFAYIIAIAKQKNVPVHLLDKNEFRSRFENAGGIALEAESRVYSSLDKTPANPGLSACLCGIEDPYNLGSAVRSLYAAGANLCVLPERDWSFAEPTLVRASAGAWERMDIVFMQQDEQLRSWSEDHSIPLVCSARDHAKPLFSYTFPKTCCLVIGGALRGISAVLLKETEHVYIPYGRDFKNALDTPSAAAIMAFTWTSQHSNWQND